MDVTFKLKDGIVILVNPGVPLRFGSDIYDNARWIVVPDVLDTIRKQNPTVKFVEG